jgi:putative SOS response-associated peptidase YedK
MCGRLGQTEQIETIEKALDLIPSGLEYPQLFNLPPGIPVPVVTQEIPNQLQLMKWTYVPADGGRPRINIRAEAWANKENKPDYTGPWFVTKSKETSEAFKRKRCLIPVNYFFEGPEEKGYDEPYLVSHRERPIFCLAGLYETHVNKKGEHITGFGIVTLYSNKVTQSFGHHRCPIILSKEEEKQWLLGSDKEAIELIKPYPYQKLKAYPVSNEMKSGRINSIEFMKPVGEEIFFDN